MLRWLAKRRFAVRGYHTKQCFGYRRKPSLQVTHGSSENRAAAPNLWRLATAYQSQGHKAAKLDPLNLTTPTHPAHLKLEYYGLDPQQTVNTRDILFAFSASSGTAAEVVSYLQDMYTGPISLDVSAVTDEDERDWLVRHYECARQSPLTSEEQRHLAKLLVQSQAFDVFMSRKFTSVKRYGAEGSESLLVFFEWLLSGIGKKGVREVVVCMPHRGRLNLLTGLLGLKPQALFHKLQGKPEFAEDSSATGDVISHLVSSIDLADGVHVSVLPNPSHLEAVNPVALGKTRARETTLNCFYTIEPSSQVLCVAVHGDASFTAQGVVLECFSLAAHPHFDTGGCVHLVLNNGLGFTTEGKYGRSSQHPSDVGRVIGAPVLHVNGDHPHEVARAAIIALDYQRQFEKDIIVNMTCFRRWGHNELDNPSLTQPAMYRAIEARDSVPDIYCSLLEEEGVLAVGERRGLEEEYLEYLNRCLTESRNFRPKAKQWRGWGDMKSAPSLITQWDTGCPLELLKFVGAKSVHTPKNLSVHPRLMSSHVNERLRRLETGRGVDWATAEALAFGSLLCQGFRVRLSGQDVGRGTFSHRHVMVVCQESENAFIPLNHISPDQSAFLEVANSPLSEEAVLGFEYGFSTERPDQLVIWEAQFGDFFNGAQTMIDTFVTCGESKWELCSGLVLLLPHGYDGAGPDHSSCHVERFLQSCDSQETGLDGDSVNIHVAHPTTPAQYYHLLRRQVIRDFRKPLVVQSPKTLLRLPDAVSSLTEMGPGTTFEPVLSDRLEDNGEVKRVVLCSGKHYYALNKHRAEIGATDSAIVRLELLCPFPAGLLQKELAKFPNATEFVWSQEEPQNMGPWTYVSPRFRHQLGIELRLVSRAASAAAAVGVANVHTREATTLLEQTFSK